MKNEDAEFSDKQNRENRLRSPNSKDLNRTKRRKNETEKNEKVQSEIIAAYNKESEDFIAAYTPFVSETSIRENEVVDDWILRVFVILWKQGDKRAKHRELVYESLQRTLRGAGRSRWAACSELNNAISVVNNTLYYISGFDKTKKHITVTVLFQHTQETIVYKFRDLQVQICANVDHLAKEVIQYACK